MARHVVAFIGQDENGILREACVGLMRPLELLGLSGHLINLCAFGLEPAPPRIDAGGHPGRLGRRRLRRGADLRRPEPVGSPPGALRVGPCRSAVLAGARAPSHLAQCHARLFLQRLARRAAQVRPHAEHLQAAADLRSAEPASRPHSLEQALPPHGLPQDRHVAGRPPRVVGALAAPAPRHPRRRRGRGLPARHDGADRPAARLHHRPRLCAGEHRPPVPADAASSTSMCAPSARRGWCAR